jgi:hypothetical protein
MFKHKNIFTLDFIKQKSQFLAIVAIIQAKGKFQGEFNFYSIISHNKFTKNVSFNYNFLLSLVLLCH